MSASNHGKETEIKTDNLIKSASLSKIDFSKITLQDRVFEIS
jgi:hypothetical protein